jgi:hypothetical protein
MSCCNPGCFIARGSPAFYNAKIESSQAAIVCIFPNGDAVFPNGGRQVE